MHPDLSKVTSQLEAAQAEVHRLAQSVDDATWVARPAPESWSISECVAHLALTTEAFLPMMREQLQRPEARGRAAPARMRRGPLAWVLCRSLEPPARSRYPTTSAFVPDAATPKEAALGEFDHSQEALLATIRLGDGADLTPSRRTAPIQPAR